MREKADSDLVRRQNRLLLLEALRQEQQTQRALISERVVLKDDYREDIREVKQLLKDLSAKIDQKVDKR